MKTLTAATLAAFLAAGATYAVAQQGQGSQGQAPQSQSGWEQRRAERMERFMRDELPALTDARIGGLKAGLKLTPEQEKLWPPVEQALRDMAAQRMQAMQQRRAERGNRGAERPDPMQQLDRMVDRSAQMSSSLARLRDAAKPLYATFDDRQKQVLPTLVRQARHKMAGGGGYGWGRHGDGEHRGMMGGGMMGGMGRHGEGRGPNWGDGQPQRQ
jgi:hypothetical protein